MIAPNTSSAKRSLHECQTALWSKYIGTSNVGNLKSTYPHHASLSFGINVAHSCTACSGAATGLQSIASTGQLVAASAKKPALPLVLITSLPLGSNAILPNHASLAGKCEHVCAHPIYPPGYPHGGGWDVTRALMFALIHTSGGIMVASSFWKFFFWGENK